MPESAQADRFVASRGRISFYVSLVAILWTLVIIWAVNEGEVPGITPIGWGVWLLVPMVWVFGLPGLWRWSQTDRARINDELAREHQHSAAVVSMFVLMAGLAVVSLQVLGYASLPTWWPVATIGAGVGTAGFCFAWLQMSLPE